MSVMRFSRRFSRRFLLIVAAFGVGVLLLLLGLRLWIATQISPGPLVKNLESRIDGRVEIEDTSLSLLRFPAEVRLKGFKISGRDGFANRGVPLADRPKLDRWAIAAEDARLQVSLWSLLSGKIDVEDLYFDGLDLDTQVRPDGSWNITSIFAKPNIVNGERLVPEKTAGDTEKKKKKRHVIHAKDFPMATQIRHIQLQRGAVQALLKKGRTLIDVGGLEMEITNLDIDPGDLVNHNHASFTIKGALRVAQPEKGVDYTLLHLDGSGELTLFDPVTGAFAPKGQGRCILRDPCVINLLPSLEKIAARVEILRRLGIDVVDEIPHKVEFRPDTEVAFTFEDGRLTTTTALSSYSGQFDLIMAPGAWIEPANGEHRFDVALLASQSLSSRVLSTMRETAQKIPGTNAREEFLRALETSLFKDGLFRPEFSSTGEIGDPDVDLENEIPDIGDFLRGVLQDIGIDKNQQDGLEKAGKDLLKGLLGS